MQVIKYLAEFAVRPMFRTPLFIQPEEWGITDYENITFPSLDGTPLEGWWLKAKNSHKLIIGNHPMPMSRAGFCGHSVSLGVELMVLRSTLSACGLIL